MLAPFSYSQIVWTTLIGLVVFDALPDGWTVAGTTTSYRWYVNGRKVAGATGRAFRPPARYRGDRLTVRVTGTAPGYATVHSTSPRTARLR